MSASGSATQVRRPALLWVPMLASSNGSVPPTVADLFSVVNCPPGQSVGAVIEQVLPQAVCFEFDYPDRDALAMAADLKRRHPRLPMFIITVQHSEQLAVWTFRSRFCDYLVQPVAAADFERVHGLVCEANGLRSRRDPAADRQAGPPAPPTPPEAGRSSRQSRSALAPALYYVQTHYRDKIESAEVAALCGMSPFRFSRSFHETYGLTFRDYVVRYRLKEAKRLLRNPHASITDVAYAVGFNDLSYFSRMFRRYFGAAPSALLNQLEAAARAGDSAPRTAAAGAAEDSSPTGVLLRLPEIH